MFRRTVALVVTASACLGFFGCGSPSPPPQNPTVLVAQTISGNWVLKSFRPSQPLGEPWQSLLDAQASALTVSFTESTFSASGPGVSTHGRYQIDVAVGNQFSGTLYDSDGVPYQVAGRIDGSRLEFTSKSERWRGNGELERR